MAKIPQINLLFWIIKILATTFGETGGDALSMTFDLGYAISSLIFIGLFFATLFLQIKATKFHPFLYWAVIVATTTAGTTMADYADRSLGLGYLGGVSLLAIILAAVLAAWYFSLGSLAVADITTLKGELFYWATILFSNTLGTALGDFAVDDFDLGYELSAAIFSGLLAIIVVIYKAKKISPTLLFWAAFVLTRPLGATVGDLITKPIESGGFAIGRVDSSLLIAGVMIVFII
ncbi:MAG: hypothetical protein WCL30_06745, partial [Pseudomonadota bacterium]